MSSALPMGFMTDKRAEIFNSAYTILGGIEDQMFSPEPIRRQLVHERDFPGWKQVCCGRCICDMSM